MKTETQATLTIKELTVSDNLFLDPEGFVIKVFFANSRADTKSFKITSQTISINQTIKIASLLGNQLQLWFCTTYDKIIGIGTIPIKSEGENVIQFKLINTDFGKLIIDLSVNKRQIEKQVYIEPDEQLLKKVQDPLQKLRLEQEQKRKARQLHEQQQALKAQKKPIITFSQFNKKEEPYI